MLDATTHFAPNDSQPRSVRHAGSSTLLSVTALAGVPGMVSQEFGEKVLRHANRAAMLDIELIEDENCFIPHATMTAFLHEVERRAGAPDLGLLIAPRLTVERYGCYGRYILAAETLGDAIRRSMAAMPYHSRGDSAALTTHRGTARFTYASVARGREGYRHVALGALGVMVNLCRSFLPEGWRPLQIEMDLPRPRHSFLYEDAFDCPTVFEADSLAVCFDAQLLERRGAVRRHAERITLDDLARARTQPMAGDGLPAAVAAHVWAQVLAGAVSIESTANALEISVRSLQRALNREGVDFRRLSNLIRARRAKELLTGTDASITEIACTLGYSSPAHFARAFRNIAKMSPGAFRRLHRHSLGVASAMPEQAKDRS